MKNKLRWIAFLTFLVGVSTTHISLAQMKMGGFSELKNRDTSETAITTISKDSIHNYESAKRIMVHKVAYRKGNLIARDSLAVIDSIQNQKVRKEAIERIRRYYNADTVAEHR